MGSNKKYSSLAVALAGTMLSASICYAEINNDDNGPLDRVKIHNVQLQKKDSPIITYLGGQNAYHFSFSAKEECMKPKLKLIDKAGKQCNVDGLQGGNFKEQTERYGWKLNTGRLVGVPRSFVIEFSKNSDKPNCQTRQGNLPELQADLGVIDVDTGVRDLLLKNIVATPIESLAIKPIGESNVVLDPNSVAKTIAENESLRIALAPKTLCANFKEGSKSLFEIEYKVDGVANKVLLDVEVSCDWQTEKSFLHKERGIHEKRLSSEKKTAEDTLAKKIGEKDSELNQTKQEKKDALEKMLKEKNDELKAANEVSTKAINGLTDSLKACQTVLARREDPNVPVGKCVNACFDMDAQNQDVMPPMNEL